MGQLTEQAAAAIAGPDWLRARRRAAAQRFVSSELPTTSDEIWRYSRINDLDLDRFELSAGPSGPQGQLPAEAAAIVAAIGETAAVIVVTDGAVVSTSVADAAASAGLVVTSGDDVEERSSDGGLLVGDALRGDALLDLHDAFVGEVVSVDVPKGAVLDRPVVIVTAVGGTGVATFPRLLVDVGEQAEATVIHLAVGSESEALSVPVIEQRVAQGGRLRWLGVQDLGARTWQLAHSVAVVERDAALDLYAVALGGDYARLRADVVLAGTGAEVDLGACYFSADHQMHDFRTLQDHVAGRTASRLLFKGAVDDEASAVYSGLIRIEEQAAGSVAHQTNRNITLSPQSSARSVPNLEILNNDVVCSHASAVGPVDDDQRFYLESRGVHPGDAERLIVGGFFADALATLHHDGLRAWVAARLQERIASHDAGAAA